MASYFIASPQGQQGPFPAYELAARGVLPGTLVWTEGMAEWLPARDVPEVAALFPGLPPSVPPGAPQVPFAPATSPSFQPSFAPVSPSVGSDKRIVAGIFGILFGAFGVHKFILGYTGTGLLMLAITFCTCGIGYLPMHIIGFIEGIIYLSKSDAEFSRTYVQSSKEWF
jgi:TM2 domain-containing membrane protein YozV